jgi:hypothetical protein
MKTPSKSKAPETVYVPPPGSVKGQLKAIGGSTSDDFNNILANQVRHGLWRAHSDKEAQGRQLQAVLAALMGIGPRDELEGMLAGQLTAVHAAAMECFRRAMIEQQSFEGRRENLSQANKLVRSYAALLEALDRHRGQGTPQRVIVERVNVSQGGQAIVGPVHAGGGALGGIGEQPHAQQLAYAPGATMPGDPSAQREAVPVSAGGEA